MSEKPPHGTFVYQHPRNADTPAEAECYRQSLQNWFEGNFPPEMYLDPRQNATTTLHVYPLYQWLKSGEQLVKLNRELQAGVAEQQQALQEELLTARMLILQMRDWLNLGEIQAKTQLAWAFQDRFVEFADKITSPKPPKA